jgi:uncharacterized protein YcbK (DUF882 family)
MGRVRAFRPPSWSSNTVRRSGALSRSSRYGATLLFAVHVLTGGAGAAAQAPLVSVSSTPPGAWPSEPLELASPGGLGRSGAIRAIVASPAAPLDLTGLQRFGGGWENGHRWMPLIELTLPGDAALSPTHEVSERIVAPSRAGSWVLESQAGTRVPVLTPVPADQGSSGYLNGYHLGIYPTAGSNRTDAYRPPDAFLEVTPENRDLAISRHLTLGQFLTKDQFDVWPKYLALDMRLVDKLELVIAELNAMGIRADRLHVMSGFRTPQYNGPGGDGRATLSRHMWGDAADVWVDNDGDGLMDDLNGDGQIDLDDAAVMLRAVERVERKYPELVGGAETYPTTSTHGPYIHIDARGERARW